ncbi:MAG: hypothetical protein WAM75_15385 [Xanthobacteraceae bacterium]
MSQGNSETAHAACGSRESSTSAKGRLDCFYASMRSCHRHARSNNLMCVTNPNRGRM